MIGKPLLRKSYTNDIQNVENACTTHFDEHFDTITLKQYNKIYATQQASGPDGTLKSAIKDKQDVVNYIERLVADSCVASGESMSLKEELDSVKARLVDEAAAALKPGKAQQTGVVGAWKKIEPLQKAIDCACSDGEELSCV